MPLKQTRICSADPPWMNRKLKSLILKRQKAFQTQGSDPVQFKHFRNLVNRERKVCRAKYFDSRIQQLKDVNPKKWWEEVKRLSGSKSSNGDLVSQTDVEEFSNLSQKDQANAINCALLAPLEEYRLTSPLERLPMESDSPEILTVTEDRVQKVLTNLNPKKACGPDKIPNWLLKEYSDIVAFPVMQILNASYYEQRLPTIWKMADVTPLSKKKLVHDLKKD